MTMAIRWIKLQRMERVVGDNDRFTVTCLAIPRHMEADPAGKNIVFDSGDISVKDTWTGHISEGNVILAEPEDYITLR